MSSKVVPHELLENLSFPYWKDELTISFGAFSFNYKKQQTQAVPRPASKKNPHHAASPTRRVVSQPPLRGDVLSQLPLRGDVLSHSQW